MGIFKTTLVLLPFLLSLGCQQSSDSPESAGPDSTTPVVEQNLAPAEFAPFDGNLTDANMKILVRPLEDFGKYELRISWTKTIKNMQMQIGRGPLLTKRDTSHYAQIVSQGQNAQIHFRVLNDQDEVISAMDAEVTIPTDLLVTGKMYLQADTVLKLGRLHIQDGMIVTNGYKLTIEADEILHHHENFTGLNLDPAKHSIMTYDKFPKNEDGRYGQIDRNIIISTRTLLGGFSIALIDYDPMYPSAKGVLEGASVPDLVFRTLEKKNGSLSVMREIVSNRWRPGSLVWGITSVGIDSYWIQ